MWVAAMRLYKHSYMQHEAGLLSGDTWAGWEKQILIVSVMPGFRSTWPGIRMMMTPSFVAWMDASTEDATRFAGAYRDALAAGGIAVETLGERLTPPDS